MINEDERGRDVDRIKADINNQEKQMAREVSRLSSEEDQIWASMREEEARLKMIADNGIQSEEDKQLAETCVLMVATKLTLDACRAQHPSQ